MRKKIRIFLNGITLDDANLVPFEYKSEYWKKRGAFLVVMGSQQLFEKLNPSLYDRYINIGTFKEMGGGFHFIFNSLIRNFIAFKYLLSLKDCDVAYSISSVLDLIIVPFILKKTGKVKKWVTVLDNTVPLVSGGKIISGNLIVRILAWIFFHISLIILKSADVIFAVKPELKTYLVSKGFNEGNITVTGNGVEKKLIEKAKVVKKYQSDALYVGRINEAKGIYDLLKVVKSVKKIYPHFKLAIMGLGDKNTMMKFLSKVDELGLTTNIKFLGFRTGQQKYDIIKSCKLFLFLSKTESVPVAPMEAICTGKITLVYDLDAYDMYKHDEIIKFKLGDHMAVAEKVIGIINSKKFTNKSGKRLLKKYNWDTIAKREMMKIVN